MPGKKFRRPKHTFAHGFFEALSDRGVRILLALTASVILVGTFLFSFLEGWDLIDSAYFSTVTIATVGYGDLAPKTAAGKLFTMAYIVIGIGLFVALATALADHLVQRARGDLGLAQKRDDGEG